MSANGLDTSRAAITRLLADMRAGHEGARERFVDAVYYELKRMARQHLRGERPGHSVQASALVNELYVRMIGREGAAWENRAHFFSVAASNMRRILIDRARTRKTGKRGGHLNRVDLDENLNVTGDAGDAEAEKLIALDDALTELARMDERQSRIVELRFFAGLTAEATAEAMGLSRRTVMREWAMARAWLYSRIHDSAAPGTA